MGLAILPARLQEEMQNLANCILAGNDPVEDSSLEKHAAWAKEFLSHYMRNGVSSITRENVMDILKSEIGKVFVHVLEDAGVYKCTPDGRTAFMRFIKAL
jgi:UDPglucose--hexose-1-phosphate uridylyltransferase